jgi:hypothetical protein
MQFGKRMRKPDMKRDLFTYSISGNKLISVQTAKKEGDKSTKVIREFNDDEVIQTMEIVGEDVACIQIFKRVA